MIERVIGGGDLVVLGMVDQGGLVGRGVMGIGLGVLVLEMVIEAEVLVIGVDLEGLEVMVIRVGVIVIEVEEALQGIGLEVFLRVVLEGGVVILGVDREDLDLEVQVMVEGLGMVSLEVMVIDREVLVREVEVVMVVGVGDQGEEVHQGLGEMEGLGEEVDIRKI